LFFVKSIDQTENEEEAGVYALIAGKMKITPARVCQGWEARLVGGLLILAPVAGLVAPFIYGLILGARVVAEGRTSIEPAEVKEASRVASMLSFWLCLGIAIVAIVVGLWLGKPPATKRSLEDDDREFRRALAEPEGRDKADLPPREPPDEHIRPEAN